MLRGGSGVDYTAYGSPPLMKSTNNLEIGCSWIFYTVLIIIYVWGRNCYWLKNVSSQFQSNILINISLLRKLLMNCMYITIVFCYL